MVAYAWISLDHSGHQHLQYQKVSAKCGDFNADYSVV